MKCEKLKTLCGLKDPDEETAVKEQEKPSVERKKIKSEVKYNDFVKKLYKTQKLKDLK